MFLEIIMLFKSFLFSLGANTPGQAAKVVLKSVRWFYSEMLLEKLKLGDGFKRIAP